MNSIWKPLSSRKKSCFLLFSILCLGSVLRLSGLEHESMWNDELSSCFRSSFSSLGEVVTRGVVPDVHPPGFQILLYFVEQTMGDSAGALRIFPAIAGILTIPLVYLTGRKLFSDSTALLASAMLAFSPVHIWLSQEARPYAFLVFLAAASVGILLRLINNLLLHRSPGIWNSTGFVLTGILLEYTHYFGLMVFLLEAAVLLFVSLKSRKSIIAVICVIAAPLPAYIPWIPSAIMQSGSGSYITPPGIGNIAILFFEYMGWSKFLLVVFAVTVAAASVLFAGRNERKVFSNRSMAIPVLWLILPLATSLIVSFTLVPVFTVRNMMIALPAVFLLFAAAIHIVFSRDRNRNLFGIAVCCYMLFSLFFVRKHYTEPHRNQFREATAYVAQNYNSETETIITASAWNIAYFDYYFRRNPGNLSVDMKTTDCEDFQQFCLLKDSISPGEVWLLWGHVEPDPALIDSISLLFNRTDYQQFMGAGVWHFQEELLHP